MSMSDRIKAEVMDELDRQRLDQVCDSAYTLDPEFTPNYTGMAVELGNVAGFQIRVVGAMIALANVGYDASPDTIHRSTRRALRILMVKMRSQAQKWLDDHPEAEGG